jgi:hypothetical protein
MRKAARKRTRAKPAALFRKQPKSKKARGKDATTGVRSGTKRSTAIDMLHSPAGATIAALTKATGWQQHSVRGFLAGVVKKRLKFDLQSAVIEGVRIYRITDGPNAALVATKPDGRKP